MLGEYKDVLRETGCHGNRLPAARSWGANGAISAVVAGADEVHNPSENTSIQPHYTVITPPVLRNLYPREGGYLNCRDVTLAFVDTALQGGDREQNSGMRSAHVLPGGVY